MSGEGGPLPATAAAIEPTTKHRREPDDVAAARMFDKVVKQIDVLLVNDPDQVGLITAGEVHRLRRLIVARQEMIEQGLHRPDVQVEGVRARYGDDSRENLPAQQETA